MRGGPFVVVVGRSLELDLALGALEALALGLRVIPTVREAERALLAEPSPRVSAVLVGLTDDPEAGLRLIRSLRSRPGLADVPVVVWAPDDDSGVLAEAYRLGASSGVRLGGGDDDPLRLAQVIHYWAAANEPHTQEAFA